jgi:lysophospholipase L1-like esterase
MKVMQNKVYQGDTALYFQLTHNIADYGKPVSAAYTQIIAYEKSGMLVRAAAEIAQNSLTPPPQVAGNVFTLHAYYIMYPVGLLARIFPVPPLLMTLYVAAFIGMLCLVYLALRRKKLPIVAALLFCLIVVSHPAWADSLMFGQFYPDRLFMFFGLAFMYLVSREGVPRGVLVAAAIITASIIERAALTAGIFTLVYVALYWRRTSDRIFKLLLGIALLIYGFLLLKYVLVDPAYSSFLPKSFAALVGLFSRPGFLPRLEVFLVINALLLVIAAFEWRAAAIAFILMLPNILGSIGGAEKIGWATHYHSFYFPALVWAATLGFAVAYKKAIASKRAPVFYAGGLAIALALSMIAPFSFSPMSVSLANVRNNVMFTFLPTIASALGPNGRKQYEAREMIAQSVPKDSTVTTPESGMPYLYDRRAMYVLPFGIDTADYAVVSYTKKPGEPPTYGGVANFQGPKISRDIDAALTKRMIRDGYDFQDAVVVPSIGIAIVKREPYLRAVVDPGARKGKALLVTLGDSVTAGAGLPAANAKSYGAIVAARLGAKWTNLAVSGETLIPEPNATFTGKTQAGQPYAAHAGLLSDEVSKIPLQATVVTIYIGTTDMWLTQQSIRPDQSNAAEVTRAVVRAWSDELPRVIRAIRARVPKAKIVVGNLIDIAGRSDTMIGSPAARAAISSVVDRLNAVIAAQHVPVADLHCDGRLYQEASYVTQYSLYPNEQGHSAIAADFLSALRKSNPRPACTR